MPELFKQLLEEEEGATIIEYGLLAALISIAAIVVIGVIGGLVNELYEKVEDAVTR